MSIRDYANRCRAAVPRVMLASEDRLHRDARAGTPVQTGHARDSLRKSSELVPVETPDGARYAVFWQARDFPAGEFYVQEMLLNGKDPLTPAAEGERAQLPRDMATALRQAAR
jgi:hypothetical protein